jgi:hypothetical protein
VNVCDYHDKCLHYRKLSKKHYTEMTGDIMARTVMLASINPRHSEAASVISGKKLQDKLVQLVEGTVCSGMAAFTLICRGLHRLKGWSRK